MYYVYMITNKSNTVLYTWMTNNLERRIYEHKNKVIQWFAAKYNVYKLVYFEEYSDVKDAIIREKQLKKWRRTWKNKIIEENNPCWNEIIL